MPVLERPMCCLWLALPIVFIPVLELVEGASTSITTFAIGFTVTEV
jgi:hypothetical protein